MSDVFSSRIEIGIIADTHGLLRPEAVEFLNTCHYILHAGDIGKEAVLEQLKAIAPTFAVRGNVDKDPWARNLPDKEVVEIGNLVFCIIHDLEDLNLETADGFDVVVYGHSHILKTYHKKGLLYFNPGGAGPKRFKLPVSIGRIVITDDHIESCMIKLL
jgi:uncharacterized protein